MLRSVSTKATSPYAKAAIQSALSFKSRSITVNTQTESITFDALTVAFGIHKTNGGGLCQCPTAVVNDGLVEVTLTEKISAYHIPELLVRLYNGSFTRHSKVHSFRAGNFTADLPAGWWMEADGEPIGQGSFTLTVEKEKLTVLAPHMPGNHGRPMSSRNGHGIIASIMSNASK
ncbi:MAG TPA: hypothetical protein VEY71_10600 [Chitinophagales bacterium]|nr:hypothetical protein [Chitinophagales bacterium]